MIVELASMRLEANCERRADFINVRARISSISSPITGPTEPSLPAPETTNANDDSVTRHAFVTKSNLKLRYCVRD